MKTQPDTPIRVLVATPGLVQAMRDAGMEVSYTGLRRTPEMIVETAIREDVDVICVSILSGAHNAIFSEIMDRLHDQGSNRISVLGGGVIPGRDIAHLKEMGVREIFTPGASLVAIADYIESLVSE